MAKRRKKKSNLVKKLSIVGITLIVIQGLLVWIFQDPIKGVSVTDAVDRQLKTMGDIPESRKMQVRILTFVQDYMGKNKGKPPASLKELVPDYFATIPIDPDTKEPFEYAVIKGRPVVGRAAAAAAGGLTSVGLVAGAEIDPSRLTMDQKDMLIASLDKDFEEELFVYDPTGKMDPFRPFNVSRPVVAGMTDLEKLPISSFRLAIVMGLGDDAQALVEDGTGRGHYVRKGTKIGYNGGEVIDILPDRVLILEISEDFTGQKHHKQIELLLRPGTEKLGEKPRAQERERVRR